MPARQIGEEVQLEEKSTLQLVLQEYEENQTMELTYCYIQLVQTVKTTSMQCVFTRYNVIYLSKLINKYEQNFEKFYPKSTILNTEKVKVAQWHSCFGFRYYLVIPGRVPSITW